MKRSLCAIVLTVVTAHLLAAEVSINDAMLQDLARMQPEAAGRQLNELPAEEAVAYGIALFQLWMRDGRSAAAESILESSRQIAAAAGMHTQEAELLSAQAFLLQRRGQVREAMDLVREAVDRYERAGATGARLSALMFLGNLQHRYGALTTALQTMEGLLAQRDQMADELF